MSERLTALDATFLELEEDGWERAYAYGRDHGL
jgi:hypothetical protein